MTTDLEEGTVGGPPSESGGASNDRTEGRRRRPVTTPGAVWPVALAVALTVLGAVGGFAFSKSQVPLYAGRVVVRVYDPFRISGSQFGQVDPTRLVSLEVNYAQSSQVTAEARRRLAATHTSYDHVSWTSVSGEDALAATCYARRARDSATCANAFAQVFLQVRKAAIVAPLDAHIQSTNQQLSSLQSRATAIGAAVAAQDRRAKVASDAVRAQLARQNEILSEIAQLNASVFQDNQQASILAANYEIVETARTPSSIATPLTLRNTAVGAVAGLLVAVALLVGRRRRRVGTGPEHLG